MQSQNRELQKDTENGNNLTNSQMKDNVQRSPNQSVFVRNPVSDENTNLLRIKDLLASTVRIPFLFSTFFKTQFLTIFIFSNRVSRRAM